MTNQNHSRGPIRQSSPAARHTLLAAIVAMVALLAVAGPAAAKRWSPGETIGNISGAQKWCGVPWEDSASCPAPQWNGQHFNMHITPLLSDPRNTCPRCGGAIQYNGLAGYVQGQPGTPPLITRWVVCGQFVVVGGQIILFSAITEIKEVGVGNEAPRNAKGADVSFRCTSAYFNLDPFVLKGNVPVKWWVNIKTPKSDTERGWVYIQARDGSFEDFKVPVTRGQYSHDIDVCTPNSDPETCRAL